MFKSQWKLGSLGSDRGGAPEVWYSDFRWKETTRKGLQFARRPLEDNEFLQAEDDRLCVYRRDFLGSHRRV